MIIFFSKMYFIILIILVVKCEATIELGRIENANWILNLSHINNDYINITNTICEQCLCRMIEMNNLTQSISCQQNKMTYQILLWNATAYLKIDTNSIVYFQTIPKFLQITTISINLQGKKIELSYIRINSLIIFLTFLQIKFLDRFLNL
jgi:hypothetical protein